MVNDERIIVLDDVVYSTQYTTLTLLAKLLLKYESNPEEFTKEDMPNVIMAKRILDVAFHDENIFLRDTFMNMVLSRPEWDHFQVPEEYMEWLLSKFYEISDIDVRLSPIINMIGSHDVKIVYDDTSMLEKLIIKKLKLFERIQPSSVINMTDFVKELNNIVSNKNTNLHSRPTVFTANENIINTFGEDISIIVPKNFRWGFAKNKTLGVVECWSFDSVITNNNTEEKKDGTK